MKKTLAILAMLAFPAISFANGIEGDCADCHTMHNSEQGQAVAQVGLNGATGHTFPLQNLLRMDCIACHAQDPDGPKIAVMSGGSRVPQVYHAGVSEKEGVTAGDLAAGNFRYVIDEVVDEVPVDNQRKGHNVIDLLPVTLVAGKPVYASTPGTDNFKNPPGHLAITEHEDGFAKFTCAGAQGCHGTRAQILSGTTPRVGIAAISGAHHNNKDGAKDPVNATSGAHQATVEGLEVAGSYRFLRGLKGYGNTVDRWQNVDKNSHNEYYGNTTALATGECTSCHVTDGTDYTSTTTSTLQVPNQSMSGFCTTCHGNFHSSGTENGTSGAFLRHPSDYQLPNRGEYEGYETYDISAPVARNSVFTAASSAVTVEQDMVMCLSCHKAHASEYAGMLRFNYKEMIAGNTKKYDALKIGERGCLACHTTKGVAPGDRPYTPAP